MDNNNIEIWIVQEDNNELTKALETMKKSSYNILISGCTIRLIIDNQEKQTDLDMALYNSEKSAVIFFSSNKLGSYSKIKQLLKDNKIQFCDVSLKKKENKSLEPTTYDMLKSKKELEKTINYNKCLGNNYCTYYPKKKSYFILECYTTPKKRKMIDIVEQEGAIEIGGTTYYLTNEESNKEKQLKDVFQAIRNSNINLIINTKERKEYPKQYQKNK